MITLINYSDHNMTISQEKNKVSALKHGVDQVVCYGPDNVSAEFKRFNAKVWNTERGSGLWVWKAYIIYDMLLDLPEGSVCIYSDSGIEWIDSVRHIVNRMDEDIFFFTNTFKQVEWTKARVMDAILPDWRSGKYDNLMQVQASVIFFKVTDKVKKFVYEWLLYCQMPGLIDAKDGYTEGEYKTFAAGREDQSILCALQIKYGYKLHWYPSTTGHHVRQHTPDDSYPQLFIHSRKRNWEW